MSSGFWIRFKVSFPSGIGQKLLCGFTSHRVRVLTLRFWVSEGNRSQHGGNGDLSVEGSFFSIAPGELIPGFEFIPVDGTG